MPRLLKMFKFFDNNIAINSVKASHDGTHVIVSSAESDNVFIVS